MHVHTACSQRDEARNGQENSHELARYSIG